MKSPYAFSFTALVVTIFLLPIFFIPSSLVPIAAAKMVLIALGSALVFAGLLFDIWKRGKVEMPSRALVGLAIGLPLVYAVSAYISGSTWLSLYGYTFEGGTAMFVLECSVLMLGAAYALTTRARILKLFSALFASLLLVAVFMIIKIASGGTLLVLANFPGNMSSPVGAWTDVSVALGLLALCAVLISETLQGSAIARRIMYAVFVVSLGLLVVINFMLVWVLLFGAALIILGYFKVIEKKAGGRTHTWPVAVLLAVSLLLIFNPVVSSRGTIGDSISALLHVSNADVRPSFASTWTISRQTLAHHVVLGSGPQTFGHDWLLYKPAAVNTTQFWNTTFTYGAGFVPTQLASVGVLGALGWIALMIYVLGMFGRFLRRTPELRPDKLLVVLSGMSALFLLSAMWVYGASQTIIALAFICVGAVVAVSRVTGVIESRDIHLAQHPALNAASIVVLVLLGVGTLAFGFKTFQKTASIYHFEHALSLSQGGPSQADLIESELYRAIYFAPNDFYYLTLSQFEQSRAQGILTTPNLPADQAAASFQDALSKSINAAKFATALNPNGYEDWVALGTLYESLVPPPLSISGAAAGAEAAYLRARDLNPQSPEILLFLARLKVEEGDTAAAKILVNQALVLKPDYDDAKTFFGILNK